MGPAQVFPKVPAFTERFAGEEQAEIVVKAFTQAAESFSKCELDRQTLIEWIVSSPSVQLEQ